MQPLLFDTAVYDYNNGRRTVTLHVKGPLSTEGPIALQWDESQKSGVASFIMQHGTTVRLCGYTAQGKWQCRTIATRMSEVNEGVLVITPLH